MKKFINISIGVVVLSMLLVGAVGCSLVCSSGPKSLCDAKYIMHEGKVSCYIPVNSPGGDDRVIFSDGSCFSEYRISVWNELCSEYNRECIDSSLEYKLYFVGDYDLALIPSRVNISNNIPKPNCGCK